MYVCQQSGFTPNPLCAKPEEQRKYKRRGADEMAKWKKKRGEKRGTFSFIVLGGTDRLEDINLRLLLLYLALNICHTCQIISGVQLGEKKAFFSVLSCSFPLLGSHRYIPPDTVNSFYAVWNTHGVNIP